MHTQTPPTRSVDWFASDFGGHIHTDPNGSWLDAEIGGDL